MRPCFKFSMSTGAAPEVSLSIMDVIGLQGVQAADFRAGLKAITGKKLNVEINSPGGDLFAGVAIYNMLKGSGKEIAVKVMGVAASAASLIAMAGDTIEMPKNTFMMVHNPMGGAIGNAADMRTHADLLDKLGASMVATYAARTGLPEDAIAEMLAVDTWMTADEALASGFATKVTDDIKATAAFDMRRADLPPHIAAIYASAQVPDETPAPVVPDETPAPVVPDETSPQTPAAAAINDMAVAANLPDLAAFFALSCDSVEAAKARIAQAKEIVAYCAIAKLPDQAEGLIRANKTTVEARALLVSAMAEADVHISTAQKQTAPAAQTTGPSPSSYWAKRNQPHQVKGTGK